MLLPVQIGHHGEMVRDLGLDHLHRLALEKSARNPELGEVQISVTPPPQAPLTSDLVDAYASAGVSRLISWPPGITDPDAHKEADVTRVTVYNHFPDEEHLSLACSSHWAPPPSPRPSNWQESEGLERRSRLALTQLYRWYRDNDSDLYPIMRDFTAMPPAFQQGVIAQFAE